MKTTKPYLIRAIHEWCSDQGFTPYLAVSVDASTRVPNEFVKDGEIVLNIGMEATQQLLLGNEDITFQARFGGRSIPVLVPIERVAAIYASENGEGMAFEVSEKSIAAAATESATVLEEMKQPETEVAPAQRAERANGPPILTRVK